jgi:hypothetical protein
LGRKAWLNLDAISAQPIPNSFGLMDMTPMKDLGYINALNVVAWALKMKLNQPIRKSQ